MSTTTTLAGTFTADPVHSSFGFAVKYQGVSLFRGTLDEVAATLVDGRLEGAAQVESISIRTPEQFRAHVLSADFFDAANHPEVKFVSSDLDLADDGTRDGQRRADDQGHHEPGHGDRHLDRPVGGRVRQHARAPAARDRRSTARSGTSTGTCRCRPAATRWPTTSR